MNELGLGGFAALFLGYGLGSIPFGFLVTRGTGTTDISTHRVGDP